MALTRLTFVVRTVSWHTIFAWIRGNSVKRMGYFSAWSVMGLWFALAIIGTKHLPDWLQPLALGARALVLVLFASVLLSTVTGTLIGLFTARIGKTSDRMTTRAFELLGGFPTIVLVALLLAIYEKPPWWLYVTTLALGRVPYAARIVRLYAARFRVSQVHLAAHGLGMDSLRLLYHHVFPQMIRPIASCAISSLGVLLMVDAALACLGFNCYKSETIQSWGSQIGLHAAQIAFYQQGFGTVLLPIVSIGITLLSLRLLSIDPEAPSCFAKSIRKNCP